MKNFPVVGIIFLVIGILMFLYIRKEKPSTKRIDGNGMLPGNYYVFYGYSILSILFGLILILQSL